MLNDNCVVPKLTLIAWACFEHETSHVCTMETYSWKSSVCKFESVKQFNFWIAGQ